MLDNPRKKCSKYGILYNIVSELCGQRMYIFLTVNLFLPHEEALLHLPRSLIASVYIFDSQKRVSLKN
jgi:hypothetical protein